MLATFVLACIAWVFFRAQHVNEAFAILGGFCSGTMFTAPDIPQLKPFAFALFGVAVMMGLEWINRHRQYGLQMDGRWGKPVRMTLYYSLIACLILMAPLGGGEFIYFQF